MPKQLSIPKDHEPFLAIAGVVGVGTGKDKQGKPQTVVMVDQKTQTLSNKIKSVAGSQSFRIEETGTVVGL